MEERTLNEQEAYAKVAELTGEAEPGWEDLWRTGDSLNDDVLKEWMRGLPESVQEVALKFPPGCLVVGTRPLVCPAPGTVGLLYSYMEDGTVCVLQHPNSAIRVQCDTDWLEVAGYSGHRTEGWVREVLDGKI